MPKETKEEVFRKEVYLTEDTIKKLTAKAEKKRWKLKPFMEWVLTGVAGKKLLLLLLISCSAFWQEQIAKSNRPIRVGYYKVISSGECLCPKKGFGYLTELGSFDTTEIRTDKELRRGLLVYVDSLGNIYKNLRPRKK